MSTERQNAPAPRRVCRLRVADEFLLSRQGQPPNGALCGATGPPPAAWRPRVGSRPPQYGARRSPKRRRLFRGARARFECVAQMFWPAVLFWLASPFMTSCPLTASWRAARAGPGSLAAPWAGSLCARPAVRVGRGVPGPGLPAACRCAAVIRRIVGRAGSVTSAIRAREDDRPDPAGLAHPASSRPSVDHPRVKLQIAEGGREKSGYGRRSCGFAGRLSRRGRRPATVTGGTDEPRRRPPAAGQRRHAL